MKYFYALKTILFCGLLLPGYAAFAQSKPAKPKFSVIGFYTGKNDQAHISYVHEANKWLAQMAQKHQFIYDSTSNWSNMNAAFLAKYQVVLFLDTRPDDAAQREAFKTYMDKGGAWMGFHFAAFAMDGTQYPQNWDWYHNTFLGSGQYVSNTWRPTAAILKVEQKHSVTKNLPSTFLSAPNEWYRWANDLRTNPDIRILLSIDPSSFPVGTGPKPHEIWHEGYYPVMWTNVNYKMLYVNMGHNDVDYEGGTNKTLSYSLQNAIQARLILNGLLWLGSGK